MIADTSALAGNGREGSRTLHGWSKALLIPPDLYPGVGGKRFRAALVEQSFAAAGGRGETPAAVIDAIEMLHAGSLVIDDFEDDSATRRRQPALHRVVGAARAVNAGNWMYFRALELAAAAYSEAPRRAAILERFVRISRECHEGQAIDLATRVDAITPSQTRVTALAISRWKTGRLVALAAWCGAHAAGADSDALRAVSAFGCRLGVCLQMANDLEELIRFADGADRCDDLRNRRVTWPWAWAATLVPTDRFASWQSRLRESGGGAAVLKELAGELGDEVVEAGAREISRRLDRAVARLDRSAVDLARPESLHALVERLRPRADVSAAGRIA